MFYLPSTRPGWAKTCSANFIRNILRKFEAADIMRESKLSNIGNDKEDQTDKTLLLKFDSWGLFSIALPRGT